jgi:DinB superfamily
VSHSERHRPFNPVFMLAAVILLSFAHRTDGQTPAATPVLLMRDGYLADLDTTHAKIMALANLIPDTKYDWRPTPEVRTVSNALMHIVIEWTVGVPLSCGGMPPADWTPESRAKMFATTNKKDVLEQLDKAWRYGRAQLAGATEAQLAKTRFPLFNPPLSFDRAAFVMAGDLHEHLGQLITYTRSIGLVPPWSK